MSSFDILTIGAATQDVFLKSKKFQEVRNPAAPDGYDDCFPLGSKIGVDDITFTTGGGATNAAVTFARFGLKTVCITRVGPDLAGDEVIRELKEEGVNTHFIQHDKKFHTAYSVILLSGSGHRAILNYRGASLHLAASAIRWKDVDAHWLYLTSLGGDMKLLRDVFAHAKSQSIRIAWNPGNLELEQGLKKLEPFLKQTTVLDLNREEAALLTELPPRQLDKIIKKLAAYPSQALVTTDGGNGAYVHACGETLYGPALKAKRVNTTGAGDAFGSAFVASLARGRSVTASFQAALLNSTGVVMHMGAKAGILRGIPSAKGLKTVKITVL